MSKLRPGSEDDVERWYFTPFDPPAAADVTPPTVEEIAAIEAAAREDGYRQGFQQGLQDGQLRLRTILALVESFQAEIKRLNDTVGMDLTTLAVEISRKIITVAFEHDPLLPARLTEEALLKLPALLEPTRVLLNPMDVAVIARELTQEAAGRPLSFSADPSVSRGGCRLMTATSEIDGTLETRWRRVTEVLEAKPWSALQLPEPESEPEKERPSDVDEEEEP